MIKISSSISKDAKGNPHTKRCLLPRRIGISLTILTQIGKQINQNPPSQKNPKYWSSACTSPKPLFPFPYRCLCERRSVSTRNFLKSKRMPASSSSTISWLSAGLLIPRLGKYNSYVFYYLGWISLFWTDKWWLICSVFDSASALTADVTRVIAKKLFASKAYFIRWLIGWVTHLWLQDLRLRQEVDDWFQLEMAFQVRERQCMIRSIGLLDEGGDDQACKIVRLSDVRGLDFSFLFDDDSRWGCTLLS